MESGTDLSMAFADIRHLTGLPYFYRGRDGRLKLHDLGLPIIDMHTHIAWRFGVARAVDQDRRCNVMHYFPDSGVPVDLSRYSAEDFPPELRTRCGIETVKPVVTTRGYVSTHTAANLTAEMADMRVSRSAVLAIDLLLSGNSLAVLDAAGRYPALIPFVSVDPHITNPEKPVSLYIARGARGLKIHPPMQLMRANSNGVHRLMDTAQSHGLPVLFHCGYSPLMPAVQKRYSRMDDFADMVAMHRRAPVILGHAGIDAWERVLGLARRYDHVYVELSGQPPHVIREFISCIDTRRLLFGSDWPYYPIALPLAKVLIATEGNPSARRAILSQSAEDLMSHISIR